jgi:hypothetical protein
MWAALNANCRMITGHGYEILSDYQRSLLKLPPRGSDGWTVQEILAWDSYRFEAAFKPVIMVSAEDASGFPSECEKGPA